MPSAADWRMIVRRTGGPDAIERKEIVVPEPGPGEVRVRNSAIGVNFIDTYHRSGLYPLELPTGLGREAAGTVEAVGAEVDAVRPGTRVAYLAQTPGSYATACLVDAAQLIALPDDIADETAAAVLLKGMTVWMLVERCARVSPGQTVLVHAAAGGVGMLLVPWLKAAGATVIAHAGTAEKAAKARANGADHALSDPLDALPEAVRALSGGRGVDTVFDGIGAASWNASLASLAKRGLLVSYGNASGPTPAFTALDLARGGSLTVTRPIVFDYADTPAALAEGQARLFTMLQSGAIEVEIGARFALADAAEAHRAIEARTTTGSVILVP